MSAEKYPFIKACVDVSPNVHGVYTLFDGDTLIYIGRAAGTGVTIRSRLQRHLASTEGPCTAKATHYARVATEDAADVEAKLIAAYKNTYGKLPRCNEVTP